MTNSKNSSSPRAPSRHGAKRQKAAPGTTDLDRPLKLGSAQALASAGLYVRTNVVLSEPRSETVRSGKWTTDITDIDVLAIVHAIDFGADIACMSCKSGTNVSVLHETFALAGVMRYLHARRGYGVFAQKATESHMIALGQQLDVALMDDREWQHWRRRISGSYPVPRMFEEAVEGALADQLRRRTDLEGLLRYLRTEFWYFRDYRNVQTLIAQLRRSTAELDASPLSQFIVLDACGLFALAILQMCEHVNTSGLLRLSETAPPYLFGGVTTYRNRKDLLRKVEDLLRKKNVLDVEQGMPHLDPSYLPDLLELILRWCNKPAAAARVPQYLNIRAGIAAANAAGFKGSTHAHGESDLTEKLALDLTELLGRAAKLRDDAIPRLLPEPESSPVRSEAPVSMHGSITAQLTSHRADAESADEQQDLLSDGR